MDGAQYGYLCWIAPGYVFAAGHGGQFIFAAPARGLVAAATADGDDAATCMRGLFERLAYVAQPGTTVAPRV